MKLEELMLDVDAVDNGVWVESNIDDNVKWKVRGSEYAPYQQALRAKISKRAQRNRGRGVDAEYLEKLSKELIAEHLLLDWEGIEGSDGEPVPYSKEQAVAFMTDRKLIPASRDIRAAIEEVDSGNIDTREEVAGN